MSNAIKIPPDDRKLRKENEPLRARKVFLDQDNSCHWYMVEAAYRAEWEAWLNIPEDAERGWEVPAFASRIDSPSQVEFQHPDPETTAVIREAIERIITLASMIHRQANEENARTTPYLQLVLALIEQADDDEQLVQRLRALLPEKGGE